MYNIDEKYIEDYNVLLDLAPFERDIQNVFYKWKNAKTRTILRLDGARQIGKTTEIFKFAYRNYTNVLYINLSETNNKDIFENAFHINVKYEDVLNSFFGEYVDESYTILIIDEIQLSPNIYNRIKEFKRQLKCDVIVTGSYLGRIINQEIYNTSEDLPYFTPLGDVQSYTMYTMSFKEFCNALGFVKDFNTTLVNIKNKRENGYNKIFSELLKLYKSIGGYPSIVRTYKNEEDIFECYQQLEQLLMKFKEESLTYYNSPNKLQIFENIFIVILDNMLRNNTVKNFSIDLITKELKEKNKDLSVSRDEINKVLTWVINSGIIGVCHRYNGGNNDSVTYNAKLYFKDLGLLSVINKQSLVDQEHFKGLQTETFAYNELSLICTAPLIQDKIFRETTMYYATSNNYELDFRMNGSGYLNNKDIIYGIEIKSGNGSHKSLDYYKRQGLINKCVLANNSDELLEKKNNWLEIPIGFIAHLFWYGDDISKIEDTVPRLSLL